MEIVARSSAVLRVLAVCCGLWLAAGLPRAAEIPTETIQKLHAATVYIEAHMVLSARDWEALASEYRTQLGERPQGPASGSGFLISRQGHLITNAHVVEEFEQKLDLPDGTQLDWRFKPSSLKVVVRSGLEGEKTYYPRILKVDPQVDLALLKIDSQPDIEPLPLNLERLDPVGTQILMGGFPGGKLPALAPFVADARQIYKSEDNPRASVNAGMITAVREYQKQVRYQLDVRANHGNSGGPITDRLGRVIGVLYAGIDGMQSVSYAVPSRELAKFLPANLGGTGNTAEASDMGSQSYDAFKNSGTFKIAE